MQERNDTPGAGDAPRVSVITPTFNRAQFLEATLRSVRGQTYPNVEHIVIDGGSTDSSVSLLERYVNTYDLRWISEPDTGMYAAINKGLRLARGELLAYLNSDDQYLPWTVEAVVDAYLASDRRPGFFFGDAINVGDTGMGRLVLQPPFDAGYVRRTGFLTQPTVFWTREVYTRDGGFDERLRFVADCEYWMRAGARWPFRRINEVLAIEHDHGQTHRAVSYAALHRELADVRRSYGGAGLQAWLLGLLDRARAYLWRRVLLVRLVAAIPRRPRDRRTAWARTVAAGRPTVRWMSLVLSLLPRLGALAFSRTVEWRRRFWVDGEGSSGRSR